MIATTVSPPSPVLLRSARVMTVDVGSIHGDLALRMSDLGDGLTEVLVEYDGAGESYEVEGSPVEGRTREEIIERLGRDWGRDPNGNAIPATLNGWSQP